MQIFITANSPGELSGWVKPVVRELKQKDKNLKIILVITPCQYASGLEREVVDNWPEIDETVKPGQYLKYVLLGIRSFSFTRKEKGVVVFLGGDPFHAVLLSKRLKIPAIAYLPKPRWIKSFNKFMVLDKEKEEDFLFKGVGSEKIAIVGDLMVDAPLIDLSPEKIYERWDLNPEKLVVTFFPGSREFEIGYMIPFFLKVAKLIKDKFPEVQFLMALSSFVPQNELNKLLNKEKVKVTKKKKLWEIEIPYLKVKLIRENRYNAMSISNLIITIPGTNTAEIASLGIPMVVAIPLNKPELIPLDGIAGFLPHNLPLIRLIKKRMVLRYSEKIKFAAKPNQKAKKEIVPEVRGMIEPEDVAKKALKLLNNQTLRQEISHQLKRTMGKGGASCRIAKLILEIV